MQAQAHLAAGQMAGVVIGCVNLAAMNPLTPCMVTESDTLRCPRAVAAGARVKICPPGRSTRVCPCICPVLPARATPHTDPKAWGLLCPCMALGRGSRGVRRQAGPFMQGRLLGDKAEAGVGVGVAGVQGHRGRGVGGPRGAMGGRVGACRGRGGRQRGAGRVRGGRGVAGWRPGLGGRRLGAGKAAMGLHSRGRHSGSLPLGPRRGARRRAWCCVEV